MQDPMQHGVARNNSHGDIGTRKASKGFNKHTGQGSFHDQTSMARHDKQQNNSGGANDDYDDDSNKLRQGQQQQQQTTKQATGLDRDGSVTEFAIDSSD
ncbi:hypothetical protein F0562_031989 [Nyssa sinensis]|uniref:Uncharacterized protein n=1 Tax=Nyssa sinensis TaxID=561372 RepID=A0A5J5AXI5_9ASTE|nr:hypothetical protein F0562_031989 [Nyssa sinensis]